MDIVNRDDRLQIIESLSANLKTQYIFPDIAEKVINYLMVREQDGEYLKYKKGRYLALALTLDMQEISNDEHLWVKWHAESLPDEGESLRKNPTWTAEQQLAARLDNFGFHKVERLPGNIGYLDIRYFHRPEWAGEKAADAMNFISDMDAIIIDLRMCPGGYPGTIILISSYLFSEETLHLSDMYWRDDDVTQQYWTQPYVPGKRFRGKPVFILIGKKTFSGAEAFAYTMKEHNRAILVGCKTDGGAHPGKSIRIHPHVEAFIPVGRAIDPLTGENWEGVGVQPDIDVPEDKSLEIAYIEALKGVILKIGKPESNPYQNLLKEAQSALENVNAE